MENLKAEIASMDTAEIRERLALIESNGKPDLIESFVMVYMRRELEVRPVTLRSWMTDYCRERGLYPEDRVRQVVDSIIKTSGYNGWDRSIDDYPITMRAVLQMRVDAEMWEETKERVS